MKITTDYFLEIQNRSGNVTERVSLDTGELIIGRGYDSDILIDDPYLCAHHARLKLENNQLSVVDTSEVNGLTIERHGEKVQSITLKPGQVFYIGWTKIQLRHRSDAIDPARVDHSRQWVFSLLRKSNFIVFSIIGMLIMLTYITWLEQTGEIRWHLMLVAPLSAFSILLLWAFGWAMVSRVIVHRAWYFTHLAIVSISTILATLGETILGYITFIVDQVQWLGVSTTVFSFMVFVATFYGHLHFSSRAKPRSQLIVSIVAAAILSIGTVYFEFEREKVFSSSPSYVASLKAPAFIFGKSKSPDVLFDGMLELKSEVREMKEDDLKKQ